VKRSGFEILTWNITEKMSCPVCGEKIPIIGKYKKPK